MAAPDALDLAELGREHHAWMQQILEKNKDLAERIGRLGLTTEFDQEADVVYHTIGPPTEALTESLDGEIYIRVEPDTLKIVGLEVWGFSEQSPTYQVGVTLFMLAMMVIGAVKQVPTATPAPQPAPPQRLAEKIQELLAAA
jgi:uncharacterized protein YuzE